MKSKCTIAVLTALLSVTLSFAQRIHDIDTFEPGKQVYSFGNNVKLRTTPDTDSKVLELLKIGEWVEIIEKTDFTWPYKGIDHSFYKVKYNDMTGYILGGLLSLDRKTVNGIHYYFAYSQERGTTYLNIRSRNLGQLYEKKVPLTNTHNFSIKTYGTRDITHLDGIIHIQYYFDWEYEEGGIYLFAHKGALTAYEISSSHDFERSYHSERFIFPDEEGGVPEKIILKKEKGNHYSGDENLWLHTSLETWKLTWENGKLAPNFRKKHAD